MYDELVKRLRDRAGAFDYDGRPDIACDYEQAANAIEELGKDLERSKEWEKFWEKEANEALKNFQTTVAKIPCWIPVEEQLPPVDKEVLVVAYGNMMRIWNIHRLDPETADVCWECEDGTLDDMCVVTHWMPLPSTEGLNET